MNEICAIAGVFSIVSLFSSIAPKTSLDSHAKPAHDVAVTNISVPSDFNQGDTIPVTVSLTNQDTHRETFQVTLTDSTSRKEIASKEVTLSMGWKSGADNIVHSAISLVIYSK